MVVCTWAFIERNRINQHGLQSSVYFLSVWMQLNSDSDKGYSVDVEPLVPMLKLSMNLTVRLSRATVVPPDYK